MGAGNGASRRTQTKLHPHQPGISDKDLQHLYEHADRYKEVVHATINLVTNKGFTIQITNLQKKGHNGEVRHSDKKLELGNHLEQEDLIYTLIHETAHALYTPEIHNSQESNKTTKKATQELKEYIAQENKKYIIAQEIIANIVALEICEDLDRKSTRLNSSH